MRRHAQRLAQHAQSIGQTVEQPFAENRFVGDGKQPAGLPGQPSAAPASPTPDSPTAPPATTPPATPTATPTTLPASAPSANAGTPVAALLTVGVLVAAGAGVAVLVLRRRRH